MGRGSRCPRQHWSGVAFDGGSGDGANFLLRDSKLENPATKCDLLSVDGGHSYGVALADVAHMHNLANPTFNSVLVDDTQCTSPYRVDAALEEHHRRGTLIKLLSVSMAPHNGKRGVSVEAFSH